MNKTNGKTRLLPFSVIEMAARGDIDPINKVLRHYEGYIIALDEYGNPHLCVDEQLRRILETKLILKIMQFDTPA